MNELCHNSNTLNSISVVGHHLGQYAIQCIDMYVSMLALGVRLKNVGCCLQATNLFPKFQSRELEMFSFCMNILSTERGALYKKSNKIYIKSIA